MWYTRYYFFFIITTIIISSSSSSSSSSTTTIIIIITIASFLPPPILGICPKPVFPQWNVTLSPTPPATPYPSPNPNHTSMYLIPSQTKRSKFGTIDDVYICIAPLRHPRGSTLYTRVVGRMWRAYLLSSSQSRG